jgi:hypothetical protein
MIATISTSSHGQWAFGCVGHQQKVENGTSSICANLQGERLWKFDETKPTATLNYFQSCEHDELVLNYFWSNYKNIGKLSSILLAHVALNSFL